MQSNVEVHLIIIEKLFRDDSEGHDDDDDDDENEEKQDEVINVYHYLINWSFTYFYIRNLLAPNIFKTTKLGNEDKSPASLITLANSPQ